MVLLKAYFQAITTEITISNF